MKQLNAFKTWKDPSHGGSCRGFVDLIGNGLLGLAQPGAQPELRQAVHKQAEHHDEAEGHDALRFLDKDGGREKEGIFEKAKAALHAALVFVRADESFVGEACWLKHVGADNPARFAKNFLRDLEIVDVQACHQLPLVACRAGICARTSLACVLRMSYDFTMHSEPAGLAFQFAFQSRMCIGFTGKAAVGEMPARLLPLGLCFAYLPLHCLPNALH